MDQNFNRKEEDISTQTSSYQGLQYTSNLTETGSTSDIMNSPFQTHVMNPLNPSMVSNPNQILSSDTNISETTQQTPGQISLVNFHQHFHTQPGSSLNEPSTQIGHSYLPIVRNKIVNNAPISTTVPEFLYQLTKMLTDNNKEVIEWANGKIDVHNPHKLASDILHRYFRHSKYASFQRQLNYFGFRKLAGKGKMSPCSYINDAATMDIRSLLTIKRKTTGSSVSNDKGLNGKKRKFDDKLSPQASYSLQRSQNSGFEADSRSLLQFSKIGKGGGGIGLIQKQTSTTSKFPIGKGVKHFLNGFQKQGLNSNDMNTQYNIQSSNVNAGNQLSATPCDIVPNPCLSSQQVQSTNQSGQTYYTNTSYNTSDDNRQNVKEYTASCINKITLSELEKNYQNSLQSANEAEAKMQDNQASPVLVSCGNSSEELNPYSEFLNSTYDATDSKPNQQLDHSQLAHQPYNSVSVVNALVSNSADSNSIQPQPETNLHLNRDSSLVDLAFIPTLNNTSSSEELVMRETEALTFVDFPNEIPDMKKGL